MTYRLLQKPTAVAVSVAAVVRSSSPFLPID